MSAPRLPSQQTCFYVLHRCFLLCGGKANVATKYFGEFEVDGVAPQLVQGAIDRLQNKRMVRLECAIGMVSMTPLGVATVERALQSPEQSSDYFPPLSSFFGLSEKLPIGVCATTLRVWLDQLNDCAGALGRKVEAKDEFDRSLSQLEHCLERSKVDPQSLRRGLLELKTLM